MHICAPVLRKCYILFVCFWMKPFCHCVISSLVYIAFCCCFVIYLLFWDTGAAPACIDRTILHNRSCQIHFTGTSVNVFLCCNKIHLLLKIWRPRDCMLSIVSLLGHAVQFSFLLWMHLVFHNIFNWDIFYMYAFSSSIL